MLSIHDILKTRGPCLSSAICRILESSGVSSQAARQRISRGGEGVLRLSGLVFPRGVRFLYHKSDFGSEKYWHALVRDIEEASPSYGAAVAALKARGGVVPRGHFDIISGAPVRQKGQISSSVILERLQAVKLVNLIDIDGVGECVALAANGHFGVIKDEELRARLLAERILLSAVKDWARNLGIASYEKVAVRGDNAILPRVGTFVWDLTAPSYIRPLLRRKVGEATKPGFFVCDVLFHQQVDEKAVTAFLRKCDLTAALPRVAPLFPVLVADGYTREALRLGRSKGVIMATTANLFGRDVASGLSALVETLTKAAAMAVARPQVIGELFNKLGQIEGAAGNLRGALFELLVGHCVVKNDDGSIDIGKKVIFPETGESAEIDVFRVKERREVWFYECKAHQPTEIVNKVAVEEWVTKKIPIIFKTLRMESRFQDSQFYFEYWTCGTFHQEALDYLKEAASRTRKYAIGHKDGLSVREYIAKVKPKSVLEMFDQHFFKHPLARIEKKNTNIKEQDSSMEA